jgi:hypothetical protein
MHANGRAAVNGRTSRQSDAARSVEYGRRASGRAMTDDFDFGPDDMDMEMSSCFCDLSVFVIY